MSAEKKTSNGAPFSICERKFPEEPVLTRTVQPVAFSKLAAISFIASVRSDAAATVTVPHDFCAACEADTSSEGKVTSDDATSKRAGNAAEIAMETRFIFHP